ncbi:MAG: hypothetical protein AB1Z98_35660 [Nannocystaceae bacterium]
MIRVVRQGARWGAVLLAMGLLAGPVTAEAADEDDTEQEQAEREVAQIKIEIKLESGRVVKPDDDFTIDFGVENQLAIDADGSSHQFMLKVEHKPTPEGSKKKKGKNKDQIVALTVGYDRDGEPIVAPYTFDAKVKKREVLRIEGGMAIAFTITPKTLAAPGGTPTDEEELPEEPVEPPKKKIEITGEDNDPLGGLE